MKKFTLIVLIFLVSVFNCSKKQVTPSEPTLPPDTKNVNGSVSGVFGSSSLTIMSAYKENSTVSSGNYSTTVSEKGTQLLFLVDTDQKLKGLTLTRFSGNQPTIMSVDETSTALSLLFLVPGITTVDPSETASTIIKLTSLPSFTLFTNELKSRLSSKTLDLILAETAVDTLYQNCVMEYYSLISSGAMKLPNDVLERKNWFDVNKKIEGSSTIIELKNYAFRKVNVHRRYLNNNDLEISKATIFEPMDGGIPASWGSIFTGKLGQPTIEYDRNYNPTASVARTEYWVIGPGFKPSFDTPPSSISTSQPWGETVFWYLAFPILDIVSGVSSLLNVGKEDFRIFYNGVKAGINTAKLANAQDTRTAAKAAIDIAVPAAKALLASGILVSKGLISSAFAAAAAKILAVTTLAFGVANGLVFAVDMFTVQPFSRFEIVNQGNFQIIVPNSTNSWMQDQQDVQIQWVTGGLAGDVKLELFKGNTLSTTIINSTSNDGDYSTFDVPSNQTPGIDYRIKITSIQNSSKYDYSDYFEIKGSGIIKITKPEAATVWFQSQQDVIIEWETGGLAGNVSIQLYKGASLNNTIISSTQNDGEYSLYDVSTTQSPGTDYRVKVTSLTNSSKFSFSSYFEIRSSAATIIGTVSDATNGNSISGATVKLIQGSTTLSTKITGTDGTYSFTNVSAGSYSLTAEKSGYISSTKSVTVSFAETRTVHFSLSPASGSIVFRIVLEWGELPEDLDAHLIKGSYHIYWDYMGSENSPPYATLDVDNTTGYGPETITIYKLNNDYCKYYVFNYSGYNYGDIDIKNSMATVKVYSGTSLIKSYSIPSTGNGFYWYVFDINSSGSIIDKNYITNTKPKEINDIIRK